MSELSRGHRNLMRAAFAVLVLVIVFFHLLPLQTAPNRWAPPDLLLGFALAWSVRRPEYLPSLLLGALFLLADLLLQRPPGLWAVLALLACENLKSRARVLSASTLAAEFATVASLMCAVSVAYFVVLSLLLVDTPSLLQTAVQLALTVLSYPLVVLATHGLMRVRKTAPRDLDRSGGRM